MKSFMKSLKEYIYEGLLDRVKNKEVNHKIFIEEFLETNYKIKGSYTIKETKNGFIVDVEGNVIVKNENIVILTNEFFEFGEVSGDFNCYYCRYLTSLKGAPKKVDGYFFCNYCSSLTSLEGAPEKVGQSFYCDNCKSLTSLEGAPKRVGRDFNCQLCDDLKSLEGAPRKVGWDFNCFNCKSLTSLKGAPEKVRGNFNCEYCKSLKTLEGAPEKVGANFNCRGCGIKFSAEDVKKYTKVSGLILWI